ncbi:hypothetical protein K2173_015352 [Erythroxylum novogranatense]|uniref:DM2 domain-containing protein n=1 Tax=Erythroxylum novogranatense TaxID=1862640 RepID=A0AAV8SRI0_9ROSI|nr:hypothetical protein K2173_015352 [Erythroxylum novogranatense]
MTEQEISQALQSLLHDHSQPSGSVLTSLSGVVQELESKLGLDLSQKSDFIRAQIQHLLQQPPSPSPCRNDHLSAAVSSVSSHPFPPHVKPEASVVSISNTLEESGTSKGKRRGGPGGLNKVCGVSPELQAIVGQSALPRTEIVKQLWAYIRKNNLQDPSNKRKIICNHELRLVFETDCTDMFKMNKLLAKHIIPLEPTKEPASKKQKLDEGAGPRQNTPAPSVAISEALASFFGVGVREMAQSEVFTRIWQYINVNSLEDPLNPMVILCDAKLQELFGCQSLPASKIPEVLARHHVFRT